MTKINIETLVNLLKESIGIEAAEKIIYKTIESANLSRKTFYTEKEYNKICNVLEKSGGFVRTVARIASTTAYRDVVKRKKEAEEELKKIDAMKDDLISMASHELKTPLTSIISLLELVLEEKVGKISEEQKKTLAIAFKDARRLNAIIDNMLDISRIESGRINYNFSKFSLKQVLEECAQTTKQLLLEKNINLKIKVANSFTIFADKDRVSQVILNLITNAIKYGKKRGSIWISASEEKGKVVLSIRDDGIGISREDLPKLFTKMFQVEKSRKEVLGGVGFGLYISKKIIEDLKGQVKVESELGKGTIFYILFPKKREKKLSNGKDSEK